MTVEWREIANHPDYIVSSEGQIGSRKWGRFKLLKLNAGKGGYLRATLCAGPSQRKYPVHHLVAEAFIGPRPTPKHQINHKNGATGDNRDHNLEWCTSSENNHHRFDVLGNKNLRGEENVSAKVTETKVREIRARRAAGEKLAPIAADYGIGQTQASRISSGKHWAWLK